MDKLLICIDGDKDIKVDRNFYFFNLGQFYKEKGYEIIRYNVQLNDTNDTILSILMNIMNLQHKKVLVLLSGSFVHNMIKLLKESNSISSINEQMSEITRVYSQINHKFDTINLFLTYEGQESYSDARTAITMNLSVNFNFNVISAKDVPLVEIYKYILLIINKKGWQQPPQIY